MDRQNEKSEHVEENKKTYSLPIGPQHPALLEGENLEVFLDGEVITDVKVNVGYLHRGVERALQNRNYIQGIYLAERICGICSGVHSVSYCQGIENLLGLEIPDRAKYIRSILCELERIHSHFLWAGVFAHEMGFDTLFQVSWRDREHVMEILEELTGNRVNYSMVTIGGVRRDIGTDKIPRVLKAVDRLEEGIERNAKVFLNDKVVLSRTAGTGPLKRSEAEELCIVGPLARASGVRFDVRKAHPYAAYDLVDWNMITDRGSDAHARAIVRFKELVQSVRIIRSCIRELKRTKKSIRLERVPLIVPPNEVMSRTEPPRGQLIYYLRSNGTDRPERIKIVTPTYTNVLGLGPMLKGQYLADLPLIIASLDPCFSCTDRVTLVDTNTWERKSYNEQGFRQAVDRRGRT
jgi:NADH-quinone oxidoreductase subunit D